MAAALDDFRRAGRPVVYVNDANGNWNGNAPAHVEAAMHRNGADVVKHLAPRGTTCSSSSRATPASTRRRSCSRPRGTKWRPSVDRGRAATEGCVLQTGIAAREHGLEVTLLAAACATSIPSSSGSRSTRDGSPAFESASGRKPYSTLATGRSLDYDSISEALEAGRGSCAVIRGDEILIAVLSRPRAALSVPNGSENLLDESETAIWLCERHGTLFSRAAFRRARSAAR